MKIAILGPECSYTHIAAKNAFPTAEFLFLDRIQDVFTHVASSADQGVVPIENMLHGSVRETLTALMKHKVKINKSFDLPINHCLAAQNENFSKISSHPQALAQCSQFLSAYKKDQLVPTVSTAKAMEQASQDATIAAIGSQQAAEHFKLNILKENIEDNHDNVTRFIAISTKETQPDGPAKTSMMLIPSEDRPGLLYDILAVFKEQSINLTKIESLPSGKKLGEYFFYIEIDGSTTEQNVQSAINSLKNLVDVYVFGSYGVVGL